MNEEISAKRLTGYKARYIAMMGLKAYVPCVPCPEGIDPSVWRDFLRDIVYGLEADARMERTWFAPPPAGQRPMAGDFGGEKREVVITDKRKVEKWVEYHKKFFAAALAFRDIAMAEARANTGVLAQIWELQAGYCAAHAETCADFWGRALHTGSYSYWTSKPQKTPPRVAKKAKAPYTRSMEPDQSGLDNWNAANESGTIDR